MIYKVIDIFYLIDEQLKNSPSRKDGINEATETTLRIYGCDLIQKNNILLRLYVVILFLLFFFNRNAIGTYNSYISYFFICLFTLILSCQTLSSNGHWPSFVPSLLQEVICHFQCEGLSLILTIFQFLIC